MQMSEVFREGLLRDQVVVVTGGGSGIGRAIAMECGRLGAKIAIGARKPERLQQTADALAAEGVEVFHAPLDIRDRAQVEAWVARVYDHFGRVDVLVNNAGGQFPSAAADISPKGWQAVIDTNLNGTWHMTQVVGKRMIAARQGGRIISMVANMWRGFPGMAHTGAARAGVVNLTQTLALEWARHDVLVNAVAPGVIRTSGLDTYPDFVRSQIETEVPKHIPLKRLGTEDDVAWAVVFLAGPAGRYVTGATICVDGGQAHWGTVFPI
jgi:citronellol/citronellal dehydrogenase